MDRNEAIEIVRRNYPHVSESGTQFESALRTLIPELKESENKEKPNGGIVLEDFNEGEGFYKVNLAYLNKEQVIEIEELVKKWNPELRESEDERIRKEIVGFLDMINKESLEVRNFIADRCGDAIPDDMIPAWIAWLEKQGSQNLANSAKTCKIEQKPTLPGFEEQEGVAGRDYIPVEWVEAIENYGKWKIVRVNEHNPAWSEEDEIGFRDAMWAIEQARTIAKNENDMGNLWYAEKWLKSLKERYAWKPSDEQMEALDNFIYAVNPDTKKYGKIIISLYDDLKKLTEH